METDNGIKGKFSVGLGLFDYINPILYGMTVITILTHMHGVMPSGLFWQLMSSVLGKPFPEDYEAKKTLLSDSGIILWDVYHSAEREGSLDSDIREPEFNDLFTLLKENPTIRVIAANASWTLRKLVNQWKRILIDPSSL